MIRFVTFQDFSVTVGSPVTMSPLDHASWLHGRE